MINIIWLRRDLQLADNASIARAGREKEPLQPVFIFDTDILARFNNKQDRRLTFIAEAIVQLHAQLAEKGAGVLVFFGQPQKIIPALAKQFGGGVYAGEDYEPETLARDKEVGKHCDLVLSKQHVLMAPHEVLKKDNTPFKVFTAYANAWREKIESHDYEVINIGKVEYADYSKSVKLAVAAGYDVIKPDDAQDVLKAIGYEYVEDKIWKPERAHKILKNFAANRIDKYDHDRNFPAIAGTSAISSYLRFGLVTIRQCYMAVKNNPKRAKWISELIWRDFYAMILFHYPETVNKEFAEQYRKLKWSYDKKNLKKWQEGKTGFPIVDAGMRQLLATGWMHNRVRMIVASFLTKDLLIDWRAGEEHFAQYLMDYDLSSNVGGWQWVAGTGTDAAPYFRVFNPELQSRKFDPQGEYIKKYVPELANLPAKEIHKPLKGNYIEPMVDHKSARTAVLKFFKDVS